MYFRHFVSSYIGGKKAMTHTPEERLETSLLSKMGAHSRTRTHVTVRIQTGPSASLRLKIEEHSETIFQVPEKIS